MFGRVQFPRMSVLQKVGRDIITAGRIMDGLGLTEGFGHVSARIPESELILITPAVAPGQAMIDDLIQLSVDGQVVQASASGFPLALETPMHLAIYRKRLDVAGICRTHSPNAVACGSASKSIRPTHGFGAIVGEFIPVHPESDLIVDPVLGDAVAKTLSSYGAVLLRGNGCLVVGDSIATAVVRAIFLEESARNLLLAASVGGAPPFTQKELRDRARWFENEISRAWTYYSRKFGAETAGEKLQ